MRIPKIVSKLAKWLYQHGKEELEKEIEHRIDGDGDAPRPQPRRIDR